MSPKLQHSRCDDGMVMIHDDGDVFAFIDSNKASPFDEELAERICVSFNAHDGLVHALLCLTEWVDDHAVKPKEIAEYIQARALLAKHGGGQ